LLYIPDIEPGLALKSLARFTDRIAATTQDTRAYLPGHPAVIVTGYPTRRDLRAWSRDQSLRALGLTDDLPVLLVFGGSKGAHSINLALWASLDHLLPVMQIVHITGQLDWPQVEGIQARLTAEKSKELAKRYHPYAFLHQEMGAALAAADLAVCRAGASTLGELPLVGLPAVLVPYPHAWRYQQVNAQYLAQRGAAVIVQDAEMPALLAGVVLDLVENSRKAGWQMRAAMRALAQPEASAKIAGQLLGLGGEA
jgi:UDP-N-acetylglucosamine--N-acetylmuramyl-(pentapeptide) pyrophosphoryl-undecaprenol N-acetylglucosamine transferase